MKEFILSFTILLSFLKGEAQLFHEDFEVAYSLNSSRTQWWFPNNRISVGGSFYDSSSIQNVGDTSILSTFFFDCSTSSKIFLSFDHICKIDFFDRAVIEVSNDSGNTFVSLNNFNSYYSGQALTWGTPFNNFNFSLTLRHILTGCRLIIENIGELTLEDSWFKGQIDGLLAVVEPPLTLRHLDEMERRLRDVMAKQSEAKLRSVAAQEEMREMLSAFITRLSTMNESSHEFQEKMESSARQIEQVRCIEDLAPLLKEVIGATRNMVEETAQARDQLQSLQTRVLATEAELIQLHMELDTASALARHDPLTDALNRKGLDEALAREIANVQRKVAPLSIRLLDIDNYKLLNDRLGHETGDKALVHLAGVTRH